MFKCVPIYVSTTVRKSDNMLSGSYKVLVIKLQLKFKLDLLISGEASGVIEDLVVTVSTLLLVDLVLYMNVSK